MDIFNGISSENINKTEIEIVQKKKHEHKFLGRYLRKRGLKLYAYSFMHNTVEEVQINRANTIHLVPIAGILVAVDKEFERAMVDSNKEYFEALNYTNALRRVKKYQEGKIEQLFNLQRESDFPIKLF